VTQGQRRIRRVQGWHVTLICLTLAAAVLAPYASQLHDAFEAAMERLGFPIEEPNVNAAPLPDYSLPGEGQGKVGQFVAVVVGMLAVFALTYGVARVLARRPEADGAEPPGAEEERA